MKSSTSGVQCVSAFVGVYSVCIGAHMSSLDNDDRWVHDKCFYQPGRESSNLRAL